jgi:trehalose synthase-fused probable maltokinase
MNGDAGLPAFLRKQRWFGAKSREIASVDEIDEVEVAKEPYRIAFVLVRVRFRDGGPEEIYNLLMGERDKQGIFDVLDDPAAARALLQAIIGRAPVDDRPVRAIGVEQSNSSVVFGDEVVLKVFRKIEPGLNPEVELGRYLSREARFPHVPPFYGCFGYSGREVPEAALAIAQGYVRARGDGWKDALESIRTHFDHPSPQSLRAYEEPARALGRVTAEMHLALAKAASTDRELAPEPIGRDDLALWARSMRARLEKVAGEDRIASLRPQIESHYAALEACTDAGLKIRSHGDYHLGQVLRTEEGGWVVLDFEGEPARPLAERRRKYSPLRDVAGMLRSFNYAGFAILFERAAPGGAEWTRLEPEAQAWEVVTRKAFLEAYLQAAGDAPMLPRGEQDRQRLLDLFELDKAVYELGYELDNRPEWARIPRRGIERIVAFGRKP